MSNLYISNYWNIWHTKFSKFHLSCYFPDVNISLQLSSSTIQNS